MAENLPPSFQFYPRDFMADAGDLPDRILARYVRGLCRSWTSGGYGIGTPDEWRVWMGYYDPGEWQADSGTLSGLFFVTPLDPIFWIQKRMVEQRDKQLEYSRKQRDRRTGSTADQPRIDRGTTADAPRSPTASASASAVESQKKKPPPAAGRLRFTPESPRRITEADVEAAATAYGLPLETVRRLAAKIAVATDARGKPYRNHPQALMNWCEREPKPASLPPYRRIVE